MTETEIRDMTKDVIVAVIDEIITTRVEKGCFQSTHEGLGVVLEEWEEFKDEIKANNNQNACDEAIQLAAAAINFVIDFKPAEKTCIGCKISHECFGTTGSGCRRYPKEDEQL